MIIYTAEYIHKWLCIVEPMAWHMHINVSLGSQGYAYGTDADTAQPYVCEQALETVASESQSQPTNAVL